MGEAIGTVAMPLLAVLALAVTFALWQLGRLWMRARFSGVPVPAHRILRLAMNRVSPRPVIDAYALAVTGGVDATLDDIEHHAMAGGRLHRTVLAAVAAKKADIAFPFSTARAMDLTGRNVVEEVQELIRAKREGDRDAAEKVSAEDCGKVNGQYGEVTVAVGPPGMILVDGQKINAVSSGGYIKKGALVRVVDVKGNIAVVEQV